jgi:hypothetical protein
MTRYQFNVQTFLNNIIILIFHFRVREIFRITNASNNYCSCNYVYWDVCGVELI